MDVVSYERLGLFVREAFLTRNGVSALMRLAARAPGEPGVVGVDGGTQIARDVRRVETLDLPPEVSDDLDRRFDRLRPELERFFGVPLGWAEPATALRYRPGDFYRAHRDRVTSLDAFYRSRRISAVLFANDATTPPAAGGFSGGALRFHGLMEGNAGPGQAIDVPPLAGTLLAFRSETLHEVLPVHDGRRITVVTWFHSA
ncbi:MAG: prolyl hydroxylase family protein [Vicinamibacterales bacterium]